MLYHLLLPLSQSVSWLSWLRVFQYPSFRIVGAFAVALVMGLALGPRVILALRRHQHGVSNVREDTPDSHQKKKGTPTMGGLLILAALTVATLLFADLRSPHVWCALTITLGYGFTGWLDDFLKISKRNSKGLAGRYKIVLQTTFLLVGLYACFGDLSAPAPWLDLNTHVTLPFVPTRVFDWDLGALYLPFLFFVIVGTSNAVNLTDGLDGLAAGPTVVSAATFCFLAYVASVSIAGFNIAQYLSIPHVEGAQELSVFAAAMAGAVVAFLWFNAYPADVFMGDVGALALGGGLGTLAVLTKNEVVSVVIHAVFLAETLSVMLQVASFKLRGKRIFRMAPIHHHFEKAGIPETKIIVRFWIVSVMCAIVGLASLKLR